MRKRKRKKGTAEDTEGKDEGEEILTTMGTMKMMRMREDG
jgi:hypothetical protein